MAQAQGLTPLELAAIAVNGFRRGFGPQAELAELAADASRAWAEWAEPIS